LISLSLPLPLPLPLLPLPFLLSPIPDLCTSLVSVYGYGLDTKHKQKAILTAGLGDAAEFVHLFLWA
jgi:hypothetical protein